AGFDVIHISNMLARLPVRRLMTKNPKTIAPTASLIEAARLMLANKISALPVLDDREFNHSLCQINYLYWFAHI
ncbi:MAG TPA: CBS domain-containing protein, partial [Campylobacterales bacterium]|nr:CBS domain-containing protein [Campylobacterales bacterium]